MSALTSLGIVHTAISLVAVAAGVACFVRAGAIEGRSRLGQVYVWTTVLTCLTAFGIFQHGGFGKPHVLAVLTLIALAVAAAGERTTFFGRRSALVAMISYTTTFLFHMIPAVTETSTRLPVDAPIFDNADAPGLQALTALLVVLFAAGVAYQVRRHRPAIPPAMTA